MNTEKVPAPQVCIIGAGAAGGIMAFELARRGIRVVVLESGPRHDFARRSEYSRRVASGENPWRTPLEALDRYTTGGSVRYPLERNRVRGVGGTTLFWEGYSIRFHASDFRLRSLYGIAEDWPLSYEDLEPYYGRAERALGVAGAPDDPWAGARSTGFPLPPFPFSYSDRVFAAACKGVGITMHHMPQARNSVAYAGRSQCRACGTCYACPTGAKASLDLTHIPQAEATGNAHVVTDVTALRLELDGRNRVDRVVYAGPDKRERRLSARLFVVAAGAVEAARLLLLSTSQTFPNGLANGSGMVGRHFTSHPVAHVAGRLPSSLYPYRIGFSTAMSRQFAIRPDRARHGAFFFEFLNAAGPLPAAIATASAAWGEDLRTRVREEFGHTASIRIFCEQLPDPGNSVGLNKDVVDYFGNPVPHLTYSVGQYERSALEEAKQVAGKILHAMGAVEIRPGPLDLAGHQIGTHRMGTDRRSSVVDPNLRAHDVPNLYLVGSGSFVTATSSPPTLTIAALAIRAAEHLASVLRPTRPSGRR